MLILNQKIEFFDKSKNFKAKRRLSWFWQEKKSDGLTGYREIKTSNPKTLGILVYIFAYLF